jgi:hypothetical protein
LVVADGPVGALPQTYGGQLAAGDDYGGPRGVSYYFDNYEFRATAGVSYTAEITYSDFGVYLYAANDQCVVIDESNVDILTFTATESRTYDIAVTSYLSNTTGQYELQIHESN